MHAITWRVALDSAPSLRNGVKAKSLTQIHFLRRLFFSLDIVSQPCAKTLVIFRCSLEAPQPLQVPPGSDPPLWAVRLQASPSRAGDLRTPAMFWNLREPPQRGRGWGWGGCMWLRLAVGGGFHTHNRNTPVGEGLSSAERLRLYLGLRDSLNTSALGLGYRCWALRPTWWIPMPGFSLLYKCIQLSCLLLSHSYLL